MLASGCQLITARMLDARRTFVAGLGLAAGLGVLIAPELLTGALPRALQSPVTAAALLAFGLNLATVPLVARQSGFAVALGSPRLGQEILDHCEELGGAWGTRRSTMDCAGHALLELAEILAARGVAEMRVLARQGDGMVQMVVGFEGEPLPRPAARPDAGDLDGPLAAQEGFAMWLATRQAQGVAQRQLAGGAVELKLDFAD
jgi:hypothetical protein